MLLKINDVQSIGSYTVKFVKIESRTSVIRVASTINFTEV